MILETIKSRVSVIGCLTGSIRNAIEIVQPHAPLMREDDEMANKIRKFVSTGSILFLVLFLAFSSMQVSAKGIEPIGEGGISAGQAETPEIPPTPTPLPEIHTYNNEISFTFGDIGERTFTLYYPSAYVLNFSMPNQWSLFTEGGAGYIDVHYDLFEDWSKTAAQPNPNLSSALRTLGPDRPYLDVVVNEVLAGSFTPEVGQDKFARIQIPTEAVIGRFTNNPFNDFTVEIQYYGNRDNFCYYDGTIKIYEDSKIHFGFREVNPVRNIAEFPRPLVQDSFLPETIKVVIPDAFTQADLEAVTAVSAALGAGTFGNVNLEVLKASEAVPSAIQNHSLIVIGQPGKNNFLQSLYQRQLLPTGLSGSNIIQYGGRVLSEADGVLQIIPSEFNNTYSYFVITGTSDTALVRAAKALPNLPIGVEGNLLVVSTDGPEAVAAETPMVRTFSSLGFRARSFFGLGVRVAFLTFYVPRNWSIQDGASIDLIYAFSDKLSEANSTVTIELNGNRIGTAPIKAGMVGEQVVRIPLRREDIRVGAANFLRLEVVMQSELDCASFDYRANWISLRETSRLNLPYVVVTNPDLLSPFVHPTYYLIYEPGMLVSLSAQPTKEEISALANLARLVGAQNGATADIMVSMDPALDMSSYPDRHIVLFGRPTTNPRIMELNDVVPQPFVTGEDNLKQRIGGVAYRVSQGIDLGMVEVIPAPWNKFKGVSVVTGTSETGVGLALRAFSDADSLFDLFGDLLFVTPTEILSFPTTEQVPELLDTLAQEVLSAGEAQLEQVSPSPQSSVTQPGRYVSEEAAQKNTTGTILLVSLVALGVVFAILGIVKTTRGGRTS